jgi:hypothetical protein
MGEAVSTYRPDQVKAMEKMSVEDQERTEQFVVNFFSALVNRPEGAEVSAQDIARFVVSFAVEDVDSPLEKKLHNQGLTLLDFYRHMYSRTVHALANYVNDKTNEE